MRTFIIRARKGTTHWDRIRANIGTRDHIEVVAHTVINAFFISNDFRADVEVYIILDSSDDFPRTIKLSAKEGLSLSGFHEEAVFNLLETTLKNSIKLQKDTTLKVAPGVEISGFGFEKLVTSLLPNRTIYLLDRKGEDIRDTNIAANPVFLLSDHLPMPKNIIKSFARQGMKSISIGKKMLFASQCVVLINHEMDRMEG